MKHTFLTTWLFWSNVVKYLGLNNRMCRYYVNTWKVKTLKNPDGHKFYYAQDIHALKLWLNTSIVYIERNEQGRIVKKGRIDTAVQYGSIRFERII